MRAALIKLWPYFLAVVLGAASAWYIRGLIADREVNAVHEDYRQEQDRLKKQVKDLEERDRKNTEASTSRVDKAEEKRQGEVVYVTQEVVKYVTKYRDSTCHLNDDWVCGYNRSLGLSCDVSATPES